MAISAFKDIRRQVDNVMHYPIKDGESIPEGALVALDAGLAINATAGDAIVGVATGNEQDGQVEVWTGGIIDVVYGGTATQAKVGTLVKVVDNETVEDAASGDNVAGIIVEFVSADAVRIRILTSGQVA